VDLLPWLLDWPPRRATIAIFLVVTVFSVGTLVLFAPVTDQINPDEATIEVTNVSVQLNDDITIPEGDNGTVQECVSSGIPGDHLAVRADVSITTPLEESDDSPYDLEVVVRDSAQRTTESIEQTGREQTDLFWVVSDDESLSVGETAEMRFRLRKSGTVVDNVTRIATVQNGTRSYDCDA
jgi:hypothetical protein